MTTSSGGGPPATTPPSAPQAFVLAGAVGLSALAALLSAFSAPDLARFVVSGAALAFLAAVVGNAVEQVGQRWGPGPTGLLQSSLGNLPELLVGIFALRAGLDQVVRAALVGSVLSNALLVLGVAFALGAVRHGTQRFEPEAPRMLVTLLSLAVAALVVPTLASRLAVPAAHHTAALSDIAAVVLLVVYLASVPFWLRGGPEAGKEQRPRPGAGRPGVSLPRALTLLGASGVATALVSDWFVSALTPATRSLGISQTFTGLVVVAIASNAVEHAVGVQFAWKARPDFAIATILNSALQVALFLTPLLVVVSSGLGKGQLTLVFPPLLVVALAVAVVVVAFVVYDGEYSWLEGVALVALYSVIAAAFWWG
jgi:Ca2+:H+ antiporter